MNKMRIRRAQPQDANTVAELLFLAMEDILYAFIKEKDKTKAIDFLKVLTAQPDNQYSYENCWLGELDNQVVCCACLYDGANLVQLRAPIKVYIETHYQANFNPEEETEAGEIYLDCVSVSHDHQGKGLGTQMLQYLIDDLAYKQKQTIGLLVDEDNPNAKKMYLKMGFKPVGNKTLVGKKLEHLQYIR